ncbi:hypothetical protein ACNKHP_13575 [Shigella boydii]
MASLRLNIPVIFVSGGRWKPAKPNCPSRSSSSIRLMR